MDREFAEHISLMAAPIYAAMVQAHMIGSPSVTTEMQAVLRKHAITQAHALWLDTLEAPD